MSHVFISYSSKNRPFALQLADNLERFYAVWIDREGIQGGLEWEQAIEEALQECGVFVVIVSPESNESDWVVRETIRAEQLDKYRIPVLLAGELPLRLLNLHFIDFQGEFEGGFRDLLEVLNDYLDPEEKQREEVSQLIGEGVRARLAGDHTRANNLIGQALVLQPEISESIQAFWAQLQRSETTQYSDVLDQMIEEGLDPIIERAKLLPQQYEIGRLAYEWSVELNVPDEILEHIDHVKYQLHPTFQSPLRIIRNRSGRFRLNMVGWGTFQIPVEICFKDGSVVRANHQLRLNV